MSTRRNYTTNTVTAGKFVEIGKSAQDLKAKLRRINLISNSSDNTAQISGIEQIAGDSVITPSEKRLLAEEWEHIEAAYNSTVSLVNQLEQVDDRPSEATSQTSKNGLSELRHGNSCLYAIKAVHDTRAEV